MRICVKVFEFGTCPQKQQIKTKFKGKNKHLLLIIIIYTHLGHGIMLRQLYLSQKFGWVFPPSKRRPSLCSKLFSLMSAAVVVVVVLAAEVFNFYAKAVCSHNLAAINHLYGCCCRVTTRLTLCYYYFISFFPSEWRCAFKVIDGTSY